MAANLGTSLWNEMPKVNSEIFTMTYGAMVTQILRDEKSIADVNSRLEKIGNSMGSRMIDEFLARSGVKNCSSFKDTSDFIAKVGFKMFLGTAADTVDWNTDKTAFTLRFGETPITDFVELPEKYKDIKYCNIVVGIIKGALEMVQLHVECCLIKDMLLGDDYTDIRVELKGVIEQQVGDDYKD